MHAGRLLAEATAEYQVSRPFPAWAEMDAEDWWQAVCATVRQVVARAGIDPRTVGGIGVDGVSWTLIPVDRQIQPLYPAMIWLDRRAEDEAAWLRAQPEAQTWSTWTPTRWTRPTSPPSCSGCASMRPQIFEAADRFLNSSGFIVARITGERTCDTTQAYGYHFFDIRRRLLGRARRAAVGIPLEKMPRLVPPLEVVGQVTAAGGAGAGLAAGIPVIAGGPGCGCGSAGRRCGAPGPDGRPGRAGRRDGHERGPGDCRAAADFLAIMSCRASTCSRAARSEAARLAWFRDRCSASLGRTARLSCQEPAHLSYER